MSILSEEVLGRVFTLCLGGGSSFGDWGFFMDFAELAVVELGSLQDFHFTDHAVLEWEDIMALISNLLSNFVLHEGFNHLANGGGASLGRHHFHHLLSDLLDVAALGIAGRLNLVLLLFSKSNREHSEEVAILSLHIHEPFDQSVPLLDQLA